MPLEPLEDVFELLDDGRTEDALAVLDGELARYPSAPRLHALRAFLLLDLGRVATAADAVHDALALDGDDAYVVRAAAALALAKGTPRDAIHAAQYAQSLDPEDPAAVMLEAQAHAMTGNWRAVRGLADRTLELDPDHERAAVLRTMAAEIDRTHGASGPEWLALVERYPMNAHARTGAGWSRLRAGAAHDAREEFEHALALDPGSTWAREGLVLALKSRYPGYTHFLKYAMWMRERTPRARRVMLIGTLLIFQLLSALGRAQPALQPFVTPLIGLYAAFVLLTWLADPVTNLLLMLKPEGKRLLSLDDQRAAIFVGASLGVALALVIAYAVSRWEAALFGAVVFAVTTLPVAGAFALAPGRRRTVLLTVAGALAFCGVMASVAGSETGSLWMLGAMIGAMISTWYASALTR